MKRIFLRLKQPLRNERGEITFFACFFVVGIVMLISFLLLYASIRITCINIRNGAKMELNNLMLPVWLPEQIIQTNTSIGQVLSSVEIDTSLVASHVTVLKNYPFIGMMGYAAGENPLSYPEVKYTMVLQLIHAAAKLVDFVILDCSTSMTNVFTPAAIEAGDVVIRILTPDLKGINYLKAHQPLLVDERFRFSEHMTFAGLARPFHALDEMGYIIGGFDGLLPYSKEIDRCATEGGMFKATVPLCRCLRQA